MIPPARVLAIIESLTYTSAFPPPLTVTLVTSVIKSFPSYLPPKLEITSCVILFPIRDTVEPEVDLTSTFLVST
ncbi:hypothetical protein D3C87_1839890 [compost metagenome]